MAIELIAGVGLGLSLFDKISSIWGNRRKVKFRIHQAHFINNPKEKYFFCKITNFSKREIETTHVWFDIEPKVYLVNTNRPLPKRLRTEESWETWIPVKMIPEKYHVRIYKCGYVRLSTESNYRSSKNKNIPPFGEVSGA